MRRENVAFLIALLSGMCALVYEIVWMRVFTPVFGLSVYATTTVLCAFMAGLGAGSILAPRLIRAWGARSFWRLYGFLEIGIALGALAIPFSIAPITGIYVSVSRISESGLLTAATRFTLSTLVMMVPALFMGFTLPVLVHACRRISREDPVTSRRIGLLYGLNTVGAAIGCLLVGFVLLYKLGVFATVLVTAGVNGSLALCAFWIARTTLRRPSPAEVAEVADPASAPRPPQLLRPGLILALYAVVGAVSFGFELCWFRLLIFYIQGATYSFSIMLVLYLLGLGLGSLFYSRFLERRFAGAPVAAASVTLGVVQALIALLGLGTLPLYRFLPRLWSAIVQTVGAESWTMIVFQKSLIAAAIIVPSTFLMGLTFPLIARIYKASGSADSTTVGRLYAVNTFGAIVGTLLTGFVLFDRVGLQNALLLMSTASLAVGVVFLLKASRPSPRQRLALAGVVVAFAGMAWAMPPRMLLSNFEAYKGNILFYRESASDIAMVTERNGHRSLAFSDGRGTSGTAPVVNYVNRQLAYSTMMMNPGARDILVISMGCGNTASAYTKFPIERLDIVDISSGTFEAAGYFFTNENVLKDPRVHTHVEDGRNFLLLTDRQYDIIEIELPTLTTDGVVNLYTKEFYAIAYARLKPGGVLSQWIDVRQSGRDVAYMLIHTMLQVFPQSTAWSSDWAWWVNGVKQDEPPGIDYTRAATLFSAARPVQDMRAVGTSFEDVLSKLVSHGEQLTERVAERRVVTDDLTVVDFLVPKLRLPQALGGGVAYYTSPMAQVFAGNWRSRGTGLDRSYLRRTTPFYESGSELESIDRSLVGATRRFPPAVLERVRAISRRNNGPSVSAR
jgi:spermidine synthase